MLRTVSRKHAIVTVGHDEKIAMACEVPYTKQNQKSVLKSHF
jgi:hypothetical protein